MAEKVTKMKLKVDLQCDNCYKKVKKVLCKFPQIQDQVYDHKNNIVMIKVVCCSPEKIRDKLCCKGCGVIKSSEIVEPSMPKPPNPPPPKEQPPPPPKEQPPPPPLVCLCPPKEQPPPPMCLCPPKDLCLCPPKEQPPPPPPVPICLCPPAPPPAVVPTGVCCVPCYEGRPDGPCFHGYDRLRSCYDGHYRRPVYDSYGGDRPCYLSLCGEYLCEENASGCRIM